MNSNLNNRRDLVQQQLHRFVKHQNSQFMSVSLYKYIVRYEEKI